jgi:large subunit ribosomal protein L25
MAIEISARKREMQGTGPARRMRRMGRVPGVLYGGDKNPVSLELDHKDLYLNLRNEKFHASILTLDIGGAKEQVLLRSVSMHPFRPQVQHIDFQRVSKDKKIHMKVPLHFINADQSPAVTAQGAIVSHVMTEIDIACLPKDLPEFIQVDLSGLDTAHSLHVSGVAMPPGVTVVSRRTGDPVVATAVVPKAAAETEETAAPAEGEVAAAAPAAEAKPAETKDEEKGAKKDSGKEEKKKK